MVDGGGAAGSRPVGRGQVRLPLAIAGKPRPDFAESVSLKIPLFFPNSIPATPSGCVWGFPAALPLLPLPRRAGATQISFESRPSSNVTHFRAVGRE